MRHLLEADDRPARRGVGVEHRRQEVARPHDLVGQQHGERFAIDELHRHADRVPEPEGFGLVHEAHVEPVQVAQAFGELVLARLLERGEQLGRRIEVTLDRRLGGVVHHDHRLDAGADRLFDDQLEARHLPHR